MPYCANSTSSRRQVSAQKIERCFARSSMQLIILTSSAQTPTTTTSRKAGGSLSDKASSLRWLPRATLISHLGRTTRSWLMRQWSIRLWSDATSLPLTTMKMAIWILWLRHKTNSVWAANCSSRTLFRSSRTKFTTTTSTGLTLRRSPRSTSEIGLTTTKSTANRQIRSLTLTTTETSSSAR